MVPTFKNHQVCMDYCVYGYTISSDPATGCTGCSLPDRNYTI